jgi:hypothetical protein
VRAVAGPRAPGPLAGIGRAVVLAASLSLLACGSGEPRDVVRSAFLGDASRLEPGKAGDPSRIYIDPAADFFSYERVVIDPVTVWHGHGSSAETLPSAELCELARRLESAIRTRMQGSAFEVVDQPRPGTLRIRAALTEGGRAETKLDLARAQADGPDATGNLSSEALAFLGRGAFELDLVDAVSGKRLAAAVDDRLVARAGEPAADVERLSGETIPWRDVDAVFDARARRLAARLSALHQLGDPDAPEAGAPPEPE